MTLLYPSAKREFKGEVEQRTFSDKTQIDIAKMLNAKEIKGKSGEFDIVKKKGKLYLKFTDKNYDDVRNNNRA